MHLYTACLANYRLAPALSTMGVVKLPLSFPFSAVVFPPSISPYIRALPFPYFTRLRSPSSPPFPSIPMSF